MRKGHTLSPKISSSLKNLAVDYFTLSALHFTDKFSNEQQILRLFTRDNLHSFEKVDDLGYHSVPEKRFEQGLTKGKLYDKAFFQKLCHS